MAVNTVFFGVAFVLHVLAFGILTSLDDTDPINPRCPCSDPRYCERIKDTTRKEIFVFSLNPKNEDWRFYDWNKVTTVVMVGYLDMQLVCLVHKYGARAMTIGNVGTSTLTNETARATWISQQLQIVKDNYLDGINFDYEDVILQSQQAVRDGYTNLVAETTEAFKSYDPSLMVSVDVAWSPDCIDQRCYDYVGLSKSSDFLFVMAYAEQSQIFGKCIAGANSDYVKTSNGLQRFLDIGIPADRLVLGISWLGVDYQCLTLIERAICQAAAIPATNSITRNQESCSHTDLDDVIFLYKDKECHIKEVPWRGVNCSDAAGRAYNYDYIIQQLKNSTTGRLWDKASLSPYFHYKDKECHIKEVPWRGVNCSDAAGRAYNYDYIIQQLKNSTTGRLWDKASLSPYFHYKDAAGYLHQVWYDDPQSLKIKFERAIDLDLRGVGLWQSECLDYFSTLPEEITAVKEMWGAFPSYKKDF